MTITVRRTVGDDDKVDDDQLIGDDGEAVRKSLFLKEGKKREHRYRSRVNGETENALTCIPGRPHVPTRKEGRTRPKKRTL